MAVIAGHRIIRPAIRRLDRPVDQMVRPAMAATTILMMKAIPPLLLVVAAVTAVVVVAPSRSGSSGSRSWTSSLPG